MKLLKRVVFLDRDGTINRDSANYIKSRAEFEFIPGSIDAIRNLTVNGFTSIVITNQSALGRRLLSRDELKAMHDLMSNAVAADGGKISDIFFCPHMPGDGCNCRKPAPGLIQQAHLKYRVDLADAVMVGDSAKDIVCALNAGCGLTVLVKSGKDPNVERELKKESIAADFVATDLLEAAEWIVATKVQTGEAGNEY